MQNKTHHHREHRHGHKGRRDLGETRGLLARAVDRVRAWLGDEDASGRLKLDARRSRRDARIQARAERREHMRQEIEERRRSAKRHHRERMAGAPPLSFIPSPQTWPWQFMGRGAPWPPNPESYYQQSLPPGVRGRPLQRRGRFTGRGPRGYVRPDARIVEDINEALTYSPHIDASDIVVRVDSGDVVLSGSVDDRYIKRLVEELIEDVAGVRDVQNDLHVETRDLQGAGGMHRSSARRDDRGAQRRDMTVGQDFEDLETSNLNTGQESCARKHRGGSFSGT
ncbi:BON domain-containing protein [Nannocystis bainbridge]|uniref:BON domain-containing protein n=1 Tax=Nannocystis bainbridge TaxID=2995303 RepID=A0ABT5E3A7_9BACT|nr:BON domain-containing protein [Nannocystis bainbridge]MDC0720352.1 BON domain-containing protein [Nannocystis bainbridge]